MKRLLDEAKRMIKINSVTTHGNEELANYATALLQDRGLKTQLQQVTHSLEDVSKRQFNVLGILGDPLVDKKIRKGLLLSSHLDTVSPGLAENWTETGGDPFAATFKDAKIFGLGAADAKLDFLCKLHAIDRFREEKLKMPIYLAATCGQEMGMFGAKYLIKSGALNPKYVVVGEPTELKLVHAHKMLNIFRVSVGYQLVERDARGFNRRIDLHSLGRSAHAAYPAMGSNAIHSALEFLQVAVDNGFEVRFTGLNGGDTVNRVPDRAMVQFYLTSHQFEDFKRFFRQAGRSDSPDRAFKVEFGGVGDTGVRFLPDALFTCVMDIVAFFRDLERDFVKVTDDSFSPSCSTVNFGQLRQKLGGIDMHFDLRLLPDLSPAEIEKHVHAKIQEVASRYPSLNVSVTRERINPGLDMPVDHELVKICKDAMQAAQIDPSVGKTSTSTEAAQYFLAGYQSLVFGPGVSHGNSHGPNEHMLTDHLKKATAFYERLIERVCL